jgi:hypothetical protein
VENTSAASGTGGAAGAAGRIVAVPLAALARLRRGKPMHPSGAVLDAVLERQGSVPPWGVPWLDESSTERAVVRLSRGAGLPGSWPDLLGLAVRVPGDEMPVDLLLSSSGRGRVLRRVPVLRRDAAGPYTSIMGYRSPAGTLRLAALRRSPALPSEPDAVAAGVRERGLEFTLAATRGSGPWRPFARLVLTGPQEPLDPDVRFDAVRHPPPGLTADGPMARFRAPAYARAQAARTAAGVIPTG